MDVELLVVPDCANAAAAENLVRLVSQEADLAIGVRVTVLTTDEDAAGRRFTGSPTFLIDGVDPFVSPEGPVGLSCRLYPTDAGLTGVPTAADLRAALGSNRPQTPA